MMQAMGLDSVKDQAMPVRLLGNFLERDRVPNAMLFMGPSGVGKRTTAIEFAKALICPRWSEAEHPDALIARRIDNGNHPDVRIAAPLKKSRTIDVEAIDSIIELASLRPHEADWRVFIIHEADRMRAPAQNHLLKTLEEPLGRSVFMLLTQAPLLLLPTIRSRCQRIRFGRLRPQTVREILQREREVSGETAEAIAAIAQGQMTRAFDLVDSEKREVILDVIRRLIEGEDPLRLSEEFAQYLAAQKSQVLATVKEVGAREDAGELSKEDREQIKEEQAALVDAVCRRDIMDILYLLEMWYRDALVYSATGDTARILNRDQLALITSDGISSPSESIGAIEKARLYLERFLNEERVFRDLFFALAP